MGGSSCSRNQQKPFLDLSGSRSHGENDGEVRCKCGYEAVVRVSRTEKNPGRAFYGCVYPKASKSFELHHSMMLCFSVSFVLYSVEWKI